MKKKEKKEKKLFLFVEELSNYFLFDFFHLDKEKKIGQDSNLN